MLQIGLVENAYITLFFHTQSILKDHGSTCKTNITLAQKRDNPIHHCENFCVLTSLANNLQGQYPLSAAIDSCSFFRYFVNINQETKMFPWGINNKT